MGYIVEYRDESHYEDVMEKMRKAKKAVCDAWEALSDMDGESMQERSYGSYRGGGRAMYRGGREEMDDDMSMRRSRDSHGRYM